MRARFARARRGRAWWALVALAGCEAPVPRVLSVSPPEVAEGATPTMVLSTWGCAPAFDLGSGTTAADSAAAFVLEYDGARPVAARRTGAEQFEAAWPAGLFPGDYGFSLVLSDGRRAGSEARVRVVPAEPVVESVTSPRATVVLGERAVPLTVRLRNDGLCAVDSLAVSASFAGGRGGGMGFDAGGTQSVTLAPRSALDVEFFVNVTGSGPGEVALGASAQDGVRTGGARCAGAVGPIEYAGGAPSRWTLVAPSARVVVLVSLEAQPTEAEAGERVALAARVRNAAARPVYLEHAELWSEPGGLLEDEIDDDERPTEPLGPGAERALTVTARVGLAARSGAGYVVHLAVTARDGAGQVLTSGGDGVPAAPFFVE